MSNDTALKIMCLMIGTIWIAKSLMALVVKRHLERDRKETLRQIRIAKDRIDERRRQRADQARVHEAEKLASGDDSSHK